LSRVFNGQKDVLKLLDNEYNEFVTHSNVLNPSKPADSGKIDGAISMKIKALQEKVDPEGLHLELMGNWLWVSGKTYQVRDALKELGFRYSKNKLCWYWRSDEHRSINQEPIPFEMIKEKYGSRIVRLT